MTDEGQIIVDKNPILRIADLSKGYPGVQALEAFDFTLMPGEIHCIVGENGAGKSTFIKLLSGAVEPDRGTIYLYDKEYSELRPDEALALGIQTVYQESILVGSLSVAENIFLGHEMKNRFGLMDFVSTAKEAEKLLSSLHIRIDPRVLVEALSTAERQMVGIAKALSTDARVLILDEPTASLSSSETELLLNLLREIKKRGVGIIYISHHLEEVFEIGDRITVLKDGKKVGSHVGQDLDQDMLIREMVGRPADLFYKKEEVDLGDVKRHVLEIRNFSRSGVVEDISFQVQSGMIFGMGGMVGSGRTELMRMIFGLDRRDSGRVFFDGQEITPENPIEAIQNGICMITEDRQKNGLVLVRSVEENILLVHTNLWGPFILRKKENSGLVQNMIDRLRIATPSAEQEVGNLSGGNQQKVVLAKWLLSQGRVFIFDEPTRGIDIGSKEEIYRLMADLIRENRIVIMVSSDMLELTALSDQVAVMREGRLQSILSKEDISEEHILRYSIGA